MRIVLSLLTPLCFLAAFVIAFAGFSFSVTAHAQDTQSAVSSSSQKQDPPQIAWLEWNDALFEKAKAEKRYVLLDLKAKWCHWCHFMDRRTYAHPVIRGLVAQSYLAVKVDQDGNPDLASRYGDWGWPATIIFDPDGKEVAKLQGFLRPSLMANILHTVIHNPDRVPKLAAAPKVGRSDTPVLNADQKKRLLALLEQTYDQDYAGWGRRLKFLQPEVIEYALEQARLGDLHFKKRVQDSLDAALKIMDHEWGGFYQYSHERDWSAPHYEKIMWTQSQNIRLYSRAYILFGNKKYLDAARKTYRYLKNFMQSPDGAFYTSQDADVDDKILGKDFYKLNSQKRKSFGKLPRIDKNIYARENGWIISSLVALYNITGDKAVLDDALNAANWILKNRSLPGGGFRHGEKDRGGPFLSSNLSMAQAMLALYMATGEQKWLKKSAMTADFIDVNFRRTKAGYITSKTPAAKTGVFKEPFVNIEENIRLARFSNLLFRTLGAKRFEKMSAHAMHYLTTDTITSLRRFLLGLVLADEEVRVEPAHITIIGARSDARSQALHQAALKLPIAYKRVDFWDPKEGPLLNPDVTYPELEKPAAFACANQICSLPVFDEAGLKQAVERMSKRRVRNQYSIK